MQHPSIILRGSISVNLGFRIVIRAQDVVIFSLTVERGAFLKAERRTNVLDPQDLIRVMPAEG
jgi:hypothetical protein